MEPPDPLCALRTFRDSFYACLHRRFGALFELTDAILTADAAPSPVHLSLEAPHRRGWGSLYAAFGPRADRRQSPSRAAARYRPAGSGTPVSHEDGERGSFADNIKLIAKPLVVKTQA